MRTNRRASFGLRATSLVIAIAFGQPTATATQPVRVGGSGMAFAAVELLAEKHAAVGGSVGVKVLPSLGTPGGIKALVEREIDVAIVTSRLTPELEAKGFHEGVCFMTPLVFATSHPQPQNLSMAQLSQIYSDPRPVWPDGMPIKVILRSRVGSTYPYLTRIVPGLKEAFDIAYKRPGIPVGATDQENVEIAQRAAGSLAIATLMQIRGEQLKLATVAIDGIVPNVRNIATGAYPFSMRVCLITVVEPSVEIARLIAYARSADGRALIENLGAEVVE